MRFLTSETLSQIVDASLHVLSHTGVVVKNTEGSKLLINAGCNSNSGRLCIPESVVSECIRNVPRSFELFTRDGDKTEIIGKDALMFNPGSTALFFKDHDNGTIRKATKQDLENIVNVVNHLSFLKLQSTAVIPSDVPTEISDLYRLHIVLNLSDKPIVTGAFSKFGFDIMRQMLEVVAGGYSELAKKPRAIFDCCPSSPLLWGDTSCQNLVDCARSRIPAEIIPAPISGATSPVSVFGSLIQSNAEVLSGLVISQLANPGAPVIYGCASAPMDMKHGLPRFGSVESVILGCASSELGKHYDLPTNAYLGTSDSKTEDAQSGFESAIGLALAALSCINIVSGPGMLAQLNCQSLEKLVIDNEICGSSYRLKRGIGMENADSIIELIDNVASGGDYLREKHTLKNYRTEIFMPSNVISRLGIESWNEEGQRDSYHRAGQRVDELLSLPVDNSLDIKKRNELDEILHETISKTA